MDKNKTNITRLKKTTVIATVAVVSLVFLFLTFRLALNSDFVRLKVKKLAEHSLSETLEADVSIQSLTGDLWKGLSVHNMLAVSKGDTLVFIQEFSVQYQILSFFSGSLRIDSARISNPSFQLRQTTAGSWNFPVSETDSKDSGFSISLTIDSFILEGGNLSIDAPLLLPDSAMSLSGIVVDTSVLLEPDYFSVNPLSISALIHYPGFPEPVSFSTSAAGGSNSVRVEELLLSTGKSMFSGEGTYQSMADSIAALLHISPLHRDDLAIATDSIFIRQNIESTIGFSGSRGEYTLHMNLESAGLASAEISVSMKNEEQPYISDVSINIQKVDAALLFGLHNDIAGFEELLFKAAGKLYSEPELSEMRFEMQVSGIMYDEYDIPGFTLNGVWQNQVLVSKAEIRRHSERISLTADLENPFEADPKWNIFATFENVDPSWWLKTEHFSGSVFGVFAMNGIGFEPAGNKWDYKLKIENSKLDNQKVALFEVVGNVSDYFTNADVHLMLREQSINGKIAVNFLESVPFYAFDFSAEKYNINEFAILPNASSSLNVRMKGMGEGSDPSNLKLEVDMAIDSSMVNSDLIYTLQVHGSLSDSVMVIEKALLKSTFAEGEISANQNIFDFADTRNKASFNLQVNEISGVSALLGFDFMNSKGTFEGEIDQTSDGFSILRAQTKLDYFQYGQLLQTESIKGGIDLIFGQQLSYNFNLTIEDPVYDTFAFNDIKVASYGVANADTVQGRIDVFFETPDVGKMEQSAGYLWMPAVNDINLQFDMFDYTSPVRTLSLQKPFNVRVINKSIRTDTLHLAAGDQTMLQLYVPYADEFSQRAFSRVRNLNLGIIQELIFQDRVLDGLLNAEINFEQTPVSISTNGFLELSKPVYRDVSLENIRIEANLENQTLNGKLIAHLDTTLLGKAEFSIPFRKGDPQEFPGSFFEEKVSGFLQLNPVQVRYFSSLFNAGENGGLDGILSGFIEMSGEAGNPNVTGNFSLHQPQFGAVSGDSLSTAFKYIHNTRELNFSGGFYALGRQAFRMEAIVPLNLDFISREFSGLSEDEPIRAEALMADFDLAILNSFIDRDLAQNIQGKLNAAISVSGTAQNPRVNGNIRMENTGFRIPKTGVQISGGTSLINVQQNVLNVNQFKLETGRNGVLNINGTVSLENAGNSSVNLAIKAERFRLYNNDDANIALDLNTQLSGTLKKPKMSGDISMKNGFAVMSNFGEKTIETVVLEDEEPGFDFAIYDSLEVDVGFKVDPGFFIRNRRFLDLEIEIAGDLDILKKPNTQPEVFGTLTSNKGYVRPLGKRFLLEEATLTFTGQADNPDIFNRSVYLPPQPARSDEQQVKIYYVIEGTAENPEFRFESEPVMDLQDQISYVLFGRPFYALDSVEQVLAGSGEGSGAGDVALDLLLSRVEALATQRLGIDVVEINNTRSGSQSGTSIKTGWYVNRRTFFAIINEISSSTPKTLFMLEYLLNQNWDVIVTQGDDRRQGVDLRWTFDY